MSVLKIDEPGEDGLYGLHTLEISEGYQGVDSHNSIDIHGFDVEFLSDSRLRFWMVNHRPAIDESGNFLDATKVGANSTVEVFDLVPGSKELNFVKTVANPIIKTPNNIAATGDGGFVVTNDHSTKTGLVSGPIPLIYHSRFAHKLIASLIGFFNWRRKYRCVWV